MKTALVSGGTRGIGKGICDALKKEGYRVICTGTTERNEENYIKCDVSSAEDRARLIEKLSAEGTVIDLLVNNAGVAPLVRNDILEMTEESFDRVLGINLKGTFFLTQAVAKLMISQKQNNKEYTSRIVNIGSISAYVSSVSRGEYCISKAGVAMVTQLFADRLSEYGIPVFEIRPGIIDTDMTKIVHEKYERLIEGGLLPLKKFGQPEDVAKMVIACASGLLDYTTGQVLNADGGFHIRRL